MALEERGYLFRQEIQYLTTLQVIFINLTLSKKVELITGAFGGAGTPGQKTQNISAPSQKKQRVTMTAQEYVAMRKKQRGMI